MKSIFVNKSTLNDFFQWKTHFVLEINMDGSNKASTFNIVNKKIMNLILKHANMDKCTFTFC